MRSMLLGAALLLASVPARAQSSEDDRGLVITGKIQRPEVQVIIGRDNLDKGFELRDRKSVV